MAEVYFVVFALECWSLMEMIAAEDVAATPAVIVVWMALEKSVTSISIFLGFRVLVLSS